ncbi:MAG: hypothetical protein M5R41_00170 [Bacteroidia bacterium]|nr:hypothetical protein [Bacteroidia bacterium]
MKKITLVLLGSCLAIIFMIGCSTTNYIGANITKPTMLNGTSALSQKSTVIKSFAIEEYSSWYFWGLHIARDADLNTTITDEIAAVDGDAVINLKIQQTLTVKDYFLSLFTFGIWTRRTSFITGDVIKYN